MNKKLLTIGFILFSVPIGIAIVFWVCGGEFFTVTYSEEQESSGEDHYEYSKFETYKSHWLFLPLCISAIIGIILMLLHQLLDVSSYFKNTDNEKNIKGDTDKESEE